MNRIRWMLFATIGLVVLQGGCAASRLWESAQFAMPISREDFAAAAQSAPLNPIEVAYAKAVELENEGSADCIDQYLACAKMLWPTIAAQAGSVENDTSRAAQLYRSSVGKLIESAQRFGRFDPLRGIDLSSSGAASPAMLPVRYHDFVWKPAEFESLLVVGDYRTPDVIHPHRQHGLGVPLLVQHTTKRPFVYPNAKFAATAILRFQETPGGQPEVVLDIVNPQSIRTMQLNEQITAPLAFDLTAPLAYYSVNEDRQWLKGFVQPDQLEQTSGLSMIEPYQRGKIPVIFIHGLASDALTWAAMANELTLHPDLLERYQFWIFAYPTGKPFPNEAAHLRRQLVELRKHIDPLHSDGALDQTVLIGHSMGGLISKLQISSSGDRLSRSILRTPLASLDMTPEMRGEFARLLFFEPSEQISRVIFIGTPHRGSDLASGTLGQFASSLVVQSGDEADQCTQFIQRNPGAFTTPMNRIPTSIDLLRPDSLMLQAIYGLPVHPRVRLNSIIGVGHAGSGAREDGDGIVAVSSARHPNAESELFVNADHDLHQHPATINEVLRVLRLHTANLRQVPQLSRQPLNAAAIR